MEFRKMVMITLYAKQKKRHRCTEQTFGLCGRRRGWDISREQHRNMYIIKGETDHQSRLDAWDKCSGLVHWKRPRGIGWRGRWEVGSGWGIHVKEKKKKFCFKMSKKKKKKNAMLSFNSKNGHLEMYKMELRFLQWIDQIRLKSRLCLFLGPFTGPGLLEPSFPHL